MVAALQEVCSAGTRLLHLYGKSHQPTTPDADLASPQNSGKHSALKGGAVLGNRRPQECQALPSNHRRSKLVYSVDPIRTLSFLISVIRFPPSSGTVRWLVTLVQPAPLQGGWWSTEPSGLMCCGHYHAQVLRARHDGFQPRELLRKASGQRSLRPQAYDGNIDIFGPMTIERSNGTNRGGR